MKKILFLLSITLLCSCNPKSDSVKTFKHKGHSYIAFGDKGVVHDPDCQYCYDKFD